MASFIYNPKVYKNWFFSRIVCLSRWAVNFRDSFVDNTLFPYTTLFRFR